MKIPTASKVNIDAIENKNMRQQGCSMPFKEPHHRRNIFKLGKKCIFTEDNLN